MNERMQELAFQAGFVGESMNPIFGTCQETALKNFAELIVRECVWQVVKDDKVPQDIQVLIGERFKQHFGVEP